MQIVYNLSLKKMTGIVHLGNHSDDETEATEALVMMVVGLKGYWKSPVSYDLTHSRSAGPMCDTVTSMCGT